MALGRFNQFDHAVYQQAIGKVVQAAKKYGNAAGVLLQDINEYEMFHQMGYRFIANPAESFSGDALDVWLGLGEGLQQDIRSPGVAPQADRFQRSLAHVRI